MSDKPTDLPRIATSAGYEKKCPHGQQGQHHFVFVMRQSYWVGEPENGEWRRRVYCQKCACTTEIPASAEDDQED